MNNLPPLSNISFLNTTQTTEVAKTNPASPTAEADKLRVPEEKSAVESARKKRANTDIIFHSGISRKTEKSISEKSPAKPLKIALEQDGSIFSEEDKSEDSAEQVNSKHAFYSDFEIDNKLSPRSGKTNAPNKSDKKNSAQVLADIAESDGVLVSDGDKKIKNNKKKSPFRLASLSFSKVNDVLNPGDDTARSSRSNASRHLSLFTSGLSSPRSTLYEDDPSESTTSISNTQPTSPRGRQLVSAQSNMPTTPRQSRASISSIFGSTEVHPAGKQLDVIARLSKSHWHFSDKSNDEKKGGGIINRIPNTIRNLLANDFRKIISDKNFQSLLVNERDIYLKEELAKLFIFHLLRAQGADFDSNLLGSFSKLSIFLKKNLGITIENKNSEKELIANKNKAETSDFLQIILDDVVMQSAKYSVERVVDLNNPMYKTFYDERKDNYFEKTKKSEKVTITQGQRSDLSATFLRDFPHSAYQIEHNDGSLETMTTPDEFIKFIDQTQSKDFVKLVSHYSNQNLSLFLNSVLFNKSDAKGIIDSEIHTTDGWPLIPTSTTKATYTFKKLANGDVILKYKGKIDTRTDQIKAAETNSLMNQTAKILIKDGDTVEQKRLVIKDADAEISMEILFSTDGQVKLNNPSLKAKGWNRLPDES